MWTLVLITVVMQSSNGGGTATNTLVPRLYRPDEMRSCGARDWCSVERSNPERFDHRG
jgi:hypothetical protein